MVEKGIPKITPKTIINYLKESEYKCFVAKMFHFIHDTIKKTKSPGVKSSSDQDGIDGSPVMKPDLDFIPSKGKVKITTPSPKVLKSFIT